IAYLIEVLVKLAERFEEDKAQRDPDLPLPGEVAMPPLPDFSSFSAGYSTDGQLPDGDMRAAFFKGQRRAAVEHVLISDLRERVDRGEVPVSGGFVTPYPPGFPVLVPGQVITPEILDFMAVLDTREIHGYDPVRGFRVLRG
ncbi:MAG: ornithine decarboxylase, partial [Actinobacteria bacterium]|nr:ornithine decarboxylase [Actinomycetota bacterium]